MQKSTPKKPKLISDLQLDPKNINKGSDEGRELIEKSIEEVGFGKSIVVDKNNVILGGNKIAEAAIAKGKQKIKIVETTGDELVVVKRMDLDINKEKGVKLKILDNSTSKKNYIEDAETVEAICEQYNFNASQYGLDRTELGTTGAIKKINIEPFRRTHVLLSFAPERLVQLQQYLEKIQKIEGVEIEQSSN